MRTAVSLGAYGKVEAFLHVFFNLDAAHDEVCDVELRFVEWLNDR